jgi:LPS sulfotransferase NodH
MHYVEASTDNTKLKPNELRQERKELSIKIIGWNIYFENKKAKPIRIKFKTLNKDNFCIKEKWKTPWHIVSGFQMICFACYCAKIFQ